MAVAINFASLQELQKIPGIGESLARLIVSVRECHGSITPDSLIGLTRGKVSHEVIDEIDFSFNEEFDDDDYFVSFADTVKKEPSKEPSPQNKLASTEIRTGSVVPGVFDGKPPGSIMPDRQGSKCPSLPGLTHWVNPGLPGLGFKPYFGKVGNTGE